MYLIKFAIAACLLLQNSSAMQISQTILKREIDLRKFSQIMSTRELEDLNGISQISSKYEVEELERLQRSPWWETFIVYLKSLNTTRTRTTEPPLTKEPLPPVSYPQCRDSSGVCYTGEEKLSCGLPTEQVERRDDLRTAKIVNGSNASHGAYPWTVGMYLQHRGKLMFFCGGSLITNKYVLTAGHCLQSPGGRRTPKRKIRLILGGHDRRIDSPHQETRSVRQIFVHKEIHLKTDFDNDIALILMDRPVKFTDYIRPVCLPEYDRSYDHEDTTIVGWGKLSNDFDGPTADILQEARVPIIQQKKCREETRYSDHEITNNMLCAGYDTGLRDACKGDSGGAMVWTPEEQNFYTQIGIVSWGEGCAQEGYPGIYTRVGKYLDWIIETTSDSCYCVSN
jgi:hypothetical protein